MILIAGHVYYWYWPRPRAADPAAAELAGLALGDDSHPFGLWLPYPHQNLGALASRWPEGEDGEGDLAADLATVADAPVPRWPRFGPFPLPPSREMAVVFDEGGRRGVAVARVYPVLASIARLAGRLAGNPWLTGGEIEGPRRRIVVTWEGFLWRAQWVSNEEGGGRGAGTGGAGAGAGAQAPPGPERSPRVPPGPDPGGSSGSGSLEGPAFAAVRLSRPWEGVPSGRYRLRRDGDDLLLDSSPALMLDPVEETLPPELLEEGVSLASVWGRGDGTRAFLLFSDLSGPGRGGGLEDGAPGFALLHAGPARRLPLAGLGLAALLGSESHSGRASGWLVLANGERVFRRGAFLVPPVAAALDAGSGGGAGSEGAGKRAAGPQLGFLLVARPAQVLEAVTAVEAALARLGPGMEEERARLAALHRLLQPLSAADRVVVASSPAASGARLRVVGRR